MLFADAGLNIAPHPERFALRFPHNGGGMTPPRASLRAATSYKGEACALFCRGLLRACRYHRHVGAPLVAGAELHLAVRRGEQRVVLAHADILAGVEFGATLAHDDVAGGNRLAAKHLHAQSLAR